METQQEYDDAVARGLEMLRTEPRAISACYDAAANRVCVELYTGYSIAFAPERSQDLVHATAEDLSEIEISYPGFAIYFPRVDADLRIPGMAKGIFGTARWEATWRTANPLETARPLRPNPYLRRPNWWHKFPKPPDAYRQSSRAAPPASNT